MKINKKCNHRIEDLFIIKQLSDRKYLVGCECGKSFKYKYKKLPKELKLQL